MSAIWEATLEFIRKRQAEMPPHLRGFDHNADEELTTRITNWLAAKVRVKLGFGDLWVRHCDGTEINVGGPFSPPPHATPGPGRAWSRSAA